MLHRQYTSIAEEPENEGSTKNKANNGATPNGTRNEKRGFKSANRSSNQLSARRARLSMSVSNEDTMDDSGSDRFSVTEDEEDVSTEDDENTNLSKSQKSGTRPGSKEKEKESGKFPLENEDDLLKDGKLNAGQIREIKEAFHVFDVNGDGCITATELKKLVTSLGYNITEAELMDMMNQIDADGNGAIDFPEFLSLMTKNLDNSDPEDILLESFKVFDRDNSGFIGVSELERVFKLLGQDFKHYEIEAMVKAADADGDGLVGYDDFQKMMNV